MPRPRTEARIEPVAYIGSSPRDARVAGPQAPPQGDVWGTTIIRDRRPRGKLASLYIKNK